MGVENMRYFAVNRSGLYIPVYETLVHSSIHTGGQTAGGSQVGTIYPNEYYSVFPNSSMYVTSFKIRFRDASGTVRNGYIETSEGYTLDDYPWNAYQEPYHFYNSNGSTLVAAASATISGQQYKVFTVKNHSAQVKLPNGTTMGSLATGTKIATDCSTAGASNPTYMVFKWKKSGNTWVRIINNHAYVFVDLGMNYGTVPSSRNIR